MADYHRAIDIPVTADQAFAFVSDLDNLPRFVPTTRHAEAEGGHVHVEGSVAGQEYHDDGQIYVDADQRLMRWGSGASAYRGELRVTERGSDAAQVEVKLHFREEGGDGPQPGQVEQSLDQSLERLKSELTSG
jgi:uncharacterized membrane protein